METTTTLSSFVISLAQRLASQYPSQDTQYAYAWLIIQHVLGRTKIDLITNPPVITYALKETINQLIKDHIVHHKPLNYILGFVPFVDTTILTSPPVLIPRMETEEWVSDLITTIKQVPALACMPLTILDMCSGSGCIAIALAKAFPYAHITAVDKSPDSFELIKKNIAYNQLTNITCIQSDLFDSLIGSGNQFDLIVSNPPYIAHEEQFLLEKSVTQWEDPLALYSDDNGLALIKKIIHKSYSFIKPNQIFNEHQIAQLVIEIGHTQGNIVKTIMNNEGYTNIQIIKDFAGNDRRVQGIKNEVVELKRY